MKIIRVIHVVLDSQATYAPQPLPTAFPTMGQIAPVHTLRTPHGPFNVALTPFRFPLTLGPFSAFTLPTAGLSAYGMASQSPALGPCKSFPRSSKSAFVQRHTTSRYGRNFMIRYRLLSCLEGLFLHSSVPDAAALTNTL